MEGRLTRQELTAIGLPWSPAFVERTKVILGGTLMAAEHVLSGRGSRAACNMAGGTHHAFRDRGSGYCIFNDLAVAAYDAMERLGVERVCIVDLDVHQGDGTAAIFADDPRVFTLSLHGARNFPLRKQRSSLDVELPDDCGDQEYLEALARHLPVALDASRPQLVFFQAGVDALEEDRLGRLSLTREGLKRRNAMLFRALLERGAPPVVTCMGGGYAQPIERSAEAHVDVFAAAIEYSAAAP
jgi:acetoin utilization deacetylase AcuC-like enzyme